MGGKDAIDTGFTKKAQYGVTRNKAFKRGTVEISVVPILKKKNNSETGREPFCFLTIRRETRSCILVFFFLSLFINSKWEGTPAGRPCYEKGNKELILHSEVELWTLSHCINLPMKAVAVLWKLQRNHTMPALTGNINNCSRNEGAGFKPCVHSNTATGELVQRRFASHGYGQSCWTLRSLLRGNGTWPELNFPYNTNIKQNA